MDTSVCATKFYRFKNIGNFTPTKIAFLTILFIGYLRPIFLVIGAEYLQLLCTWKHLWMLRLENEMAERDCATRKKCFYVTLMKTQIYPFFLLNIILS